MGREEMQAEAEVGRRKDGKCFDENVGSGLVAGEWWVELIAVCRTRRFSVSDLRVKIERGHNWTRKTVQEGRDVGQIELIRILQV